MYQIWHVYDTHIPGEICEIMTRFVGVEQVYEIWKESGEALINVPYNCIVKKILKLQGYYCPIHYSFKNLIFFNFA